MQLNYNAPEFLALREQVNNEKTAMVVDRFNNVGKLVFLNSLDPNQKVAASQEELDAKLAQIENTQLPLNCLAVAVMSKIGQREVSHEDALQLGYALEGQGKLAAGMVEGVKGFLHRHGVGSETLRERAEDAGHAISEGARRVGGALGNAAHAAKEKLEGAAGEAREHIGKHPAAYSAGAAGAAGLAAGAAMGAHHKKK